MHMTGGTSSWYTQTLGANGSDRITSTTLTSAPTNGAWFCIQALKDTTFDVLTGNMVNTTGLFLQAGMSVYGVFTKIQIQSGGSVVAYRRQNY
jgi:hypothetical protein